MFNYRKWLVLFVFLLFIINIHAGYAPTNSLAFDAIKLKAIDVNVNIALPVIITKYNTGDYFTYRTPIFYNSKSQKVDVNAFYFDSNNTKVFADIEKDEFGNSIAVFKIKNINRNKYTFYIKGNIKSSNNFLFNSDVYDLNKPINDFNAYKLPTEYIQSNSGEIISIMNSIKKSNNSLEELTNIVNWVHNNMTYDLNYSNSISKSIDVLDTRHGVCDEYANLTAAILRARGFPVRYVSGYANSTLAWAPHAWLEVYIPKQGWVSVDPTFGEIGLVDASHLVISRSTDAGDIKDKIVTSNTVGLGFGHKIENFKIISQTSFENQGYSGVLQTTLDYEKKMKVGSAFTVTANVQNTTLNPIIALLIFRTADNFKLISPKYDEQLVYLNSMQTKKIVYNYILPKLDFSSRYTFMLATQIKDVQGAVDIYTDQGSYHSAFFILDPSIYFKNKKLNIDLDIINYTNKIKKVYVNYRYNNQDHKVLKTIEPNQKIVYNKEFDINKGVINIKITGDYNYENQMTVYQDKTFAVSKVNNIDSNNSIDSNIDSNNNIWDDINSPKTETKPVPQSKVVPIAVGILFVGIIIFLVILRFKKPPADDLTYYN